MYLIVCDMFSGMLHVFLFSMFDMFKCKDDNAGTHPPTHPIPISHLHLQLPSSRSTDLKAKITGFVDWTSIGKTNFTQTQQPATRYNRCFIKKMLRLRVFLILHIRLVVCL